MLLSGKSLHKRITINAAANFFRYLVYIAVTFALTPFIIQHLGNSQYGLWVVLLSLAGYSGLLEMGIQTAIVKLVAQYNGVGNIEKINGIVVTALLFFFSVGIFAAVMCGLILPHFIHLFLKDASEIVLAKKLLVLLGLNLSFLFIGYVFGGIIYGLQKYHLKGFIDVAVQIINAALIYLLFTKGYGLLALASAKIIVDLLTVIFTWILCVIIFPKLSFKLNHASISSFKELFTIGGKIFSSTTLARIASNVEPFIITFYLTTAWTAIFSVPKRLIDYLREIVWALSTGFMPTFSELYGTNNKEMIRSIYVRYTRYILIIMLPIIVTAFVYGVPFLGLWVGQEYANKGKYALLFLTAGFFVECSQPLMGRLLVAVDKITIFVKISAYSSVLYLVLCAVLVYLHGIAGAGLSVLIVALISQTYYLITACKYLEMPIKAYLRQCYLLPFTISMVYGALIHAIATKFVVTSYVSILLQVALSYSLYALLTVNFSLNIEEKDFLKRKIMAVLHPN